MTTATKPLPVDVDRRIAEHNLAADLEATSRTLKSFVDRVWAPAGALVWDPEPLPDFPAGRQDALAALPIEDLALDDRWEGRSTFCVDLLFDECLPAFARRGPRRLSARLDHHPAVDAATRLFAFVGTRRGNVVRLVGVVEVLAKSYARFVPSFDETLAAAEARVLVQSAIDADGLLNEERPLVTWIVFAKGRRDLTTTDHDIDLTQGLIRSSESEGFRPHGVFVCGAGGSARVHLTPGWRD